MWRRIQQFNNMKKLYITLGLVLGLALASVFVFGGKADATVVQGNECNATSTRNYNGTALANWSVIKKGPGAFCGLTITGAAVGQVNFFDATTTDVTKRTGNKATSSILIATFPASAAAGTYQFDANVNDGVLYEVIGTAPTSTALTR